MALNGKQLLFVDYYMEEPNQTTAYQRAYGCGEEAARKNGSRLMTNDDVILEIAKRREVIEQKSSTSVQWVLENLKYVAERCMAPEPLVDKEGNILEWRFDSAGANKALESIGKFHGMFKDNLKLEAVIAKKLEDFVS